MDDRIICCRCDVLMVKQEVKFEYMGAYANHEVFRCPKCGQVYIDEEFAEGKMLEIEKLLEEK